MIVKNEKDNIVHCLNNVKHMIDCVAILDSGISDDGTPEIIEEYCQKHKIPCKVAITKWINFAANRTVAIIHAHNTVKECIPNVNLNEWYLMFMDADNRAYANDGKSPFPLNKAELKFDQYFADMTSGGVMYNYTWLLRMNKRWHWQKALHEFVTNYDDIKPTSGKLPGGFVFSGRSGARSQNLFKYLDDGVVLLKSLAEGSKTIDLDKTIIDPKLKFIPIDVIIYKENNKKFELGLNGMTDAREVFYAAQSFKDSGYTDFSRILYKKVTKMKGWVQEKYIAYLYLYSMLTPQITADMDELTMTKKLIKADKLRKTKGMRYLFTAMNLVPNRWEAPYEIIDMWRKEDKLTNAWKLISEIVDLPYPKEALFVDQNIYEWKFYDVASLAAYYAGKKDTHKRLLKLALKSKLIDKPNRERMEKNLTYK